MRGSSTAIALCLALFAGPALAEGDEEKPAEASFELAGSSVIVKVGDVEQTVRVGCTPASFAAVVNTAYVLCAPNIVVVVDALPKPHVLQRRALASHVISLSVKDGVVMARTDSGVKPLDEIAPSTAPALVIVTENGTTRSFRERPRKPPPPKPQISGLEIGLLGTAGAGVDTHPGVFTFFDASLVQRFPFGLSLAAYGTFGAGTGSFDAGSRSTGPFGGDVQVGAFEAHVGIDMRWFAISIGFGAGLREQGYDVEPSFAIRGRGGEIDGFTFTWHSSFMIQGPNAFGVLGGMIEFPLTKTWWLGADAELGNLRYGRFMVDLRHRLTGNGYSGTVDLRASVGLAYLQTSASDTSNKDRCFNAFFSGSPLGDTECLGTNVDYLGPAVSLGFIWRP